MSVLNVDPSLTLTIRRSFATELKRLFNNARTKALSNLAFDSVANDRSKSATVRRRLYEAFRPLVLDDYRTGENWTGRFIRRSFEKGINRGYDQVKRFIGLDYTAKKTSFLETTKLRYLDKADLLVEEALNDLQGIVDFVTSETLREATKAIRADKSARIIRIASKAIFDKAIARGNALVEAKVIAAHAEGQLRAYQSLGIKKVGVKAEWATAKDKKVCPRCRRREGKIYSLKSAFGKIPLHVRCRCIWVPVLPKRK